VPHPDTLVSGGPEIDFGIQSDDLFLLGEAKWLSGLGKGQGVSGDKDQLLLRREFCEKYGRRLLPDCRRFVVLGLSPDGQLFESVDTTSDGVSLHLRSVGWQEVCGLAEHPLSDELTSYLEWKSAHSTSRGQTSSTAERRLPRFSLDEVVDLLVKYQQRATYGAVAAVVGGSPRSLLQGRPRDRRYSWIVNRDTGLPTGYDNSLVDPQIHARDVILDTEPDLRDWLDDPR
jgi:hypothetical protein